MNKEKIALLVDSSCDVPKDVIEAHNIYVMPLKVVRDGVEFVDGIDITCNQVATELADHDFKTSLPSGGEITNKLEQIKKDGYTKVIIVTISSGLSGTNNIANLVSSDFEGLEITVIDTLSIGMGAGLVAIQTAELIAQDLEYATIIERVEANKKNLNIYFCIATLEYLKKGGRIGKVSALLGGVLDLKPIITCNEEGVYTPIAKVRSRKQSLTKTVELAAKNALKYSKVNVALAYAEFDADVQAVKALMLEKIPNINIFYEGQISPVLLVHAGPGLVGIGLIGVE